MATEMIERVAKAISSAYECVNCRRLVAVGDQTYGCDCGRESWDVATGDNLARAAIEAMREGVVRDDFGQLFALACVDMRMAAREGRHEDRVKFAALADALEDAYPAEIARYRARMGVTRSPSATPSGRCATSGTDGTSAPAD